MFIRQMKPLVLLRYLRCSETFSPNLDPHRSPLVEQRLKFPGWRGRAIFGGRYGVLALMSKLQSPGIRATVGDRPYLCYGLRNFKMN